MRGSNGELEALASREKKNSFNFCEFNMDALPTPHSVSI